jgi:hypothetical protein
MTRSIQICGENVPSLHDRNPEPKMQPFQFHHWEEPFKGVSAAHLLAPWQRLLTTLNGALAALVPHAGNARTQSPELVEEIAARVS